MATMAARQPVSDLIRQARAAARDGAEEAARLDAPHRCGATRPCSGSTRRRSQQWEPLALMAPSPTCALCAGAAGAGCGGALRDVLPPLDAEQPREPAELQRSHECSCDSHAPQPPHLLRLDLRAPAAVQPMPQGELTDGCDRCCVEEGEAGPQPKRPQCALWRSGSANHDASRRCC